MILSKPAIPTWGLEVERVKLNGKRRYLWKAVDKAGEVLDFYVTEVRDEAAARQFLEQALKHPWPKAAIRSGASTRRRK
jgi:transposase-like protein